MKNIDERLDTIERQLTIVSNSLSGFPVNSRLLTSNQNDEIDLRELWNVIWLGKWIIIGITLVFAIASVFYAKSLPNIYRAQALLAPSEESQGGGIAALAGKFGGLASLAGVSLGGGGSDKTVMAMEVMKSRQFINAFIEKYDLLVPLMAVESWDMGSDQLIIDPEVYDENSKQWVREVKPPKNPMPSAWEAYKEFMKVLSVSQDKSTSLITISISHVSPDLARGWVSSLVEEINIYMREHDVAEATKSIQYLVEKLDGTAVADMRVVFSQMIEEQTKVMMLAEVREEYVFITLDAAVIPEDKSSPNRLLIVILGVLIGSIFGMILVFVDRIVWPNV